METLRSLLFNGNLWARKANDERYGDYGQRHLEKNQVKMTENLILLLGYAPLFLFLTWSLMSLLWLMQ